MMIYYIHTPKGYGKYLESKGWTKQRQPRKINNNGKYTGKEFCKIFKGTYVANIGGRHVVCIQNGKAYNTWDSTEYTIGNYWAKEDCLLFLFSVHHHMILFVKKL